jgi:serine/threonine protein kinase
VKKLRHTPGADIFLMEHKQKKTTFVVKKMSKPTAADIDAGATWNTNWKSDIVKLMTLKCPYIIEICDAFEDDYEAYIVMEYYEKGDLGDLMRERKRAGRVFSEAVCLFLNMHLSQCFSYLLQGCVPIPG